MKKKNIKNKYPGIKKNTTFKILWGYYRRMQKHAVFAERRYADTVKIYKELKADKKTHAALLAVWKEEVGHAKKSKAIVLAITKDARRHLKRWLNAHQVLHEMADNRRNLKQSIEWLKEEEKTKKKKAKPAKSKASKPKNKTAKAKKSSPSKSTKKAAPKTKAAPPKPKLVVAKKLTVAKTPAPKASTKTPAPAAKKAAPKPAPRRTTARRDNLKRVEGIGVKIEQLLRNAGIDSFEKLSKTTKKTLRTLLDNAGSHYKASDPTTWARQAGLAAAGKWDELKKWQGELKGGRIVK